MTTLLKKAHELDQQNGLTDQQQALKAAQVKDYRRRVAKLNSAMYRDESRPPSEADFEALEKAELAYGGVSY